MFQEKHQFSEFSKKLTELFTVCETHIFHLFSRKKLSQADKLNPGSWNHLKAVNYYKQYVPNGGWRVVQYPGIYRSYL